MYYNNTINPEPSTAKTYEHNMLDEMYVVDTYRWHMSAKSEMFVDEDHSKLLVVILIT